MGNHVVVTSITFGKSATLREELVNVFPNSLFNELGIKFSDLELIELLKNADAAIIGTEVISDSILNQAPHLKIISKFGVGLDNIDEESLKNRNIKLGTTGGVNRRSVSELTLCFMLGLCRNIFRSGYKLKKSHWEKEGGQQLTGKTIGVIGCGYIGSDLVQLLAPLECKLLVNDILDKSDFCRDHGAIQTSLETLITESDLISLHVPLTKVTKQMVNKSFLNQMKSTAYLVNTSRGNIIDQDALKNALKNNIIAGAALDVFPDEPPADEEFLKLPNLMGTPHIGGNAKEAILAMGRSAIAHLVEFFRNHPPNKFRES